MHCRGHREIIVALLGAMAKKKARNLYSDKFTSVWHQYFWLYLMDCAVSWQGRLDGPWRAELRWWSSLRHSSCTLGKPCSWSVELWGGPSLSISGTGTESESPTQRKERLWYVGTSASSEKLKIQPNLNVLKSDVFCCFVYFFLYLLK